MQKFLGIIVGVIFLGLGIFMYIKNDHLVKNCTVETEAIVVDMKEDISSDNDTTSFMYYPIIEYQVNGNTIRSVMDKGSSIPTYNVNDKIIILYNPNNTKEYLVKGDSSSNVFSIIFIVLGVGVTGLGIKMVFTKN